MLRRTPLIWLLALIFILAACGGSGDEPAASETDDAAADTASESTEEEMGEEAAAEADEEVEEVAEEEAAEEEAPAAEEEAAEEEAEEEAAEEESAPAAADSPWGERPLSGVDPDTGLNVNPDVLNPGDTAIIRGEIISMNLTPTTSPEFLIQAPSGVNYRIRTQDLANTAYEDGTEIAPYQYQIGMLAQATVTLAADAALTDLATSENLVLVKSE